MAPARSLSVMSCREFVVVMVGGWVEAFVPACEVGSPVGVKVAVVDESAELEGRIRKPVTTRHHAADHDENAQCRKGLIQPARAQAFGLRERSRSAMS